MSGTAHASTPATPPPGPEAGFVARAKWFVKNDPRAPIAFFLAGFVFDAFVTERPDTMLQIVHQSIYLTLITLLLAAAMLETYGLFTVPARFRKVWSYHEHLTQFLIGTLLNVYTFFYFKSGSLFSSLVFILLVAGLMIANEFVHLKERQVVLKLALYFLCVTSFWLYVVPMMLGFVGLLAFGIAIVVANGFVWATYALIERGIRKHPEAAVQNQYRKQIQKKVLGTGYGVLGAFVLFYALQIIPPVPLSLNYIGVFHSVKKENGEYVLGYTRSKWLFWENGDQSFFARPGDQIVVFARVFAPNGFRDQLQVRWLLHGAKGWQKVDLIPITVAGGREHGFRGYTTKSNYQPGDYRVQVETTDGREIGRISLTVEADPGIDARETREIRQ